MLNNIKKALVKEVKQITESRKEAIEDLDNPDCSDIRYRYLGRLLPANKVKHVFDSVAEMKAYLIKRAIKAEAKELDAIEGKVKGLHLFSAPSKKSEYVIEVDWNRSASWGLCPKASCYVSGVGFVKSERISGCGYCKLSTAVAQILNQIPQLKANMARIKNQKKNIDRKNDDIFGYGSGYGIIPNIEGGVGVECYPDILESVGGKFERLASTDTYDAFRVII